MMEEGGTVRHAANTQSIVVMGVSGSGKSTIARALAERIGAEFCDADSLHPPGNLAKMAAGQALDDEDRWPWLHAVGQEMERCLSHHRASIVACSALKQAYRDVLRGYVPTAFFVFLEGDFDIIRARMEDRSHEFMPPSLLASQFESLEPLSARERGMRLDIELDPDVIVDRIENELNRLIIAGDQDAKGVS